jgi:hypothetical protein
MQAFDDETILANRVVRDGERARPDGDRPGVGSPGMARDAAAVLHLQRTAGNAGVVQLLRGEDDDPHGLQRVVGSGGGSPLPETTRTHMEGALGADFSSVRVHTDGDADRSAKSLGAHAYTAGEDVVFAEGHYDPTSTGGQRTLAHELTHVVQQRSGPVDGTDNGAGVRVSDPSDRFEQAAEASADRVVSDEAPVDEVQTLRSDAGPTVQRDDDEEAEPAEGVQTLRADAAPTVQREAGAAPATAEEEEPAGDVQALAAGDDVQRAEAGPEEREDEDVTAQGLFVQREDAEATEDEEPASG